MTRLAFIGTSHAAQHLSRAAAEKGFQLVEPRDADLIFVSEDTPTDEGGRRDLDTIRHLVEQARPYGKPTVLTSAVPPGFTRSLGSAHLYHQAETLRIMDAEDRARNPEQIIVGVSDLSVWIVPAYWEYLKAFRCPVLRMTWEEAELAKVAINVFLASQVDTTNRLALAAAKVGARWERVADALRMDRRIGPKAYLKPGRWTDSRHLVRDYRTLHEIE
jgi:UDPglucose 6-dehydrogenase